GVERRDLPARQGDGPGAGAARVEPDGLRPLEAGEPGLRLPRHLPPPPPEDRPRGDRLRAVRPPRRARRDSAVSVEAARGEDPHPRPLSRERERGEGVRAQYGIWSSSIPK